jgi:hypothetical protein
MTEPHSAVGPAAREADQKRERLPYSRFAEGTQSLVGSTTVKLWTPN